jgi:hypothetical protein
MKYLFSFVAETEFLWSQGTVTRDFCKSKHWQKSKEKNRNFFRKGFDSAQKIYKNLMLVYL